MNLTKQLSVFLENKPGRLSTVCAAFAKAKLSIQALTVMDSKEHSVLRVVVDEVSKAEKVLTSLSLPFSTADVVLVELKHQPGAIANICEKLAADHVNIDYMYCSSGNKNGKTLAIMKATPIEKVKSVLEAGGTKTSNGKATTKRRAPVRK